MPTPFKWIADFAVTFSGSGATDRNPTATALPTGGFMVPFTNSLSAASPIYATFVPSGGPGASNSARLFSGGVDIARDQASMAILQDGRRVYVFTQEPSAGGGDAEDVHFAIDYGPNGGTGSSIVSSTLVAGGAGRQIDPVVAASLTTGGFAIAVNDQSVADGRLLVRFYDVLGQPLTSAIVGNTTTGVSGFAASDYRHIDITALANGNYVVSWYDASPAETRFQIFTSSGSTVGSEVTIAPGGNLEVQPTTFLLGDGRFAIITYEFPGDAIVGRIYNPNGTESLSRFVIGTNANQGAGQNLSAALLHDGRFVVVWQNTAGDIEGQVMFADGTTDGASFIVNSSTVGTQAEPSVTVLADGRFAVTWTDQNPANDLVMATIFDPRDKAIIMSGTSFNDTAHGTSFDDVYFAGNGNDFFQAEGGADYVLGEAGNDTLIGGEGNDLLFGGAGNDSLQGQTGDDYLFGGADNDTLSGSTGNDILYGEGGNDLLVGDEGNDTVIGGDGNDLIYGNANDDSMDGGAGADTAYGGAGTDFIRGGAGNDVLNGEDGNDTLHGEDGADTLDGGAGADVFYGGAGNDTIYGGAGGDVLTGDAGADDLRGGDDDDSIDGGADNDTVYGGSGNDFIRGGTGNDALLGEDGADTILGEDGADSIDGGTGSDTIYGGAGNDTAVGGAGNDVLIGDLGADDLRGGDDDDSIDGGADNDTLRGEGGNDYIVGGDGDDFIDGGAGVDDLRGGAGNDTIVGGAGNDTMYGQGGNDVFRFAVGSGSDAIVGWEDGLDRIDISTYAGATFANTTITQVGGDTRVTFVGGDSVLLIGVNAATVTLADFITA